MKICLIPLPPVQLGRLKSQRLLFALQFTCLCTTIPWSQLLWGSDLRCLPHSCTGLPNPPWCPVFQCKDTEGGLVSWNQREERNKPSKIKGGVTAAHTLLPLTHIRIDFISMQIIFHSQTWTGDLTAGTAVCTVHVTSSKTSPFVFLSPNPSIFSSCCPLAIISNLF